MSKEILKVHFTDSDLINPTNPITVNVIGAGGTGSKVMTALLEMNHSLNELGHAGLFIRLWDDDVITQANLGRQRFAESEVGLYKSVAIINRINRFSGTNWKAEARKFEKDNSDSFPENAGASIYISCVDSVKARFEIAEILSELSNGRPYSNRPRYWLDFGNSQHTGQVLLSTIGKIRQPNSEKYETVASLPMVTDEFGELLKQSELEDDTPSCSLAEALEKQDLYINSSLVQMGCSLLWGMFKNGLTPYRGFFHNLKDFRTHPIKVA
ncbi:MULTISPECIES: PRTRC system ThiF family protein [Sphingobacterium]|jgi:PRTRC genetic system ThiF family protein|uniref:PRTRC system ThiF family protein n=2 Tax=Sphingobacterium TaxID=28453 RepID=D7VNK1_SPHSI|nr:MULTISPECIES: PRTRC system ThiF family protein [Sphingobacterium]EFK57498.1 PRTRC system ThiF family protein [Sphingobacterium spiritivorum ATCC 33861]QQT24416.1 PRTRC system ThiF family protein [Sphingobacterium spiritivorum]QQT36437.1 PRTRC system ThiF family protein [Sphingobacterium spiritivorum]WQD33186.1 PRTRC system ThiF family protein [Sphingobacterium spiritivorum]SUJ19290.1 thiamine biosynthesis protein ThiF [Sphingobacterium spiritivorum]